MSAPLAIQAAPSPSLSLVNGIPTCSSLDLAAHFGKQHKNVLRDIEALRADLDPEYRRLNFEPTFRNVPGPNNAIRQEPAYSLTRDGFTLLAMGFTGKRALAWKVRYIEAFNAMERELARTAQADTSLAARVDRLERLVGAPRANAAKPFEHKPAIDLAALAAEIVPAVARAWDDGDPLMLTGKRGVWARGAEIGPLAASMGRETLVAAVRGMSASGLVKYRPGRGLSPSGNAVRELGEAPMTARQGAEITMALVHGSVALGLDPNRGLDEMRRRLGDGWVERAPLGLARKTVQRLLSCG